LHTDYQKVKEAGRTHEQKEKEVEGNIDRYFQEQFDAAVLFPWLERKSRKGGVA
jgi:hypothetical protein